MEPTIEDIEARKLIGLSMETSLSEQKTPELWRNFRQLAKQIVSPLPGSYSVQVYPAGTQVQNFDPQLRFEKWAAVAVENWDTVPDGLATLLIPEGTYAKFMYRGPAPMVFKLMTYIFTDWLPRSGFRLAERPHFDFMPPEYKGPMHPEAEEEIWIPVER
ncbi:MAG: GyrI-like domain-containing protein [Bacteroidota bacterium]